MQWAVVVSVVVIAASGAEQRAGGDRPVLDRRETSALLRQAEERLAAYWQRRQARLELPVSEGSVPDALTPGGMAPGAVTGGLLPAEQAAGAQARGAQPAEQAPGAVAAEQAPGAVAAEQAPGAVAAEQAPGVLQPQEQSRWIDDPNNPLVGRTCTFLARYIDVFSSGAEAAYGDGQAGVGTDWWVAGSINAQLARVLKLQDVYPDQHEFVIHSGAELDALKSQRNQAEDARRELRQRIEELESYRPAEVPLIVVGSGRHTYVVSDPLVAARVQEEYAANRSMLEEAYYHLEQAEEAYETIHQQYQAIEDTARRYRRQFKQEIEGLRHELWVRLPRGHFLPDEIRPRFVAVVAIKAVEIDIGHSIPVMRILGDLIESAELTRQAPGADAAHRP